MSSPATDDRSGRTGTIALVLAALSTLALLAAVVTAAVLALGDDDAAATDGSERPPRPSVPEPESVGGQTIYGDRLQNAQFEIPAVDVGWTVEWGTAGGFEGKDEDGDGVADEQVLVGPPTAYYKMGWCKNEEGRDAYIAMGGLENAEESDDPKAVSEKLATKWVEITSYREDNKRQNPFTDVATEDVDLKDGADAYLSRSTITTNASERGKCDPPKLEVNALSFDTGDYVATLILVRDLWSDGKDLSDDAVEAIIDTVRKQI